MTPTDRPGPQRPVIRDDLWLPADLAVVLLHQESIRTGDARLRIKQPTLRKWSQRSHIRYERGLGYNVASVIAYVTGRGTRGHHRPST